MKKYLVLVLAVVCSLACILLTGCGDSDDGKSSKKSLKSQVAGKWGAVKLTMDDETMTDKEYRENYGRSLGKYLSMEFDKSGTGTLILEGKKKAFDWSVKDDELSIDFDDSDLRDAKSSLELDDDQLILKIKDDDHKLIVYLEKGDDDDDDKPDESESEYAKKSKLKAANTKAKLVFVTVNGAASDIISDGHPISDIKASGGVVKISDLESSSDPIRKAVYEAFDDTDDRDGYVWWDIDDRGRVYIAQWAASLEGMVGQYPNPETDPGQTHTIGREM